MRRRCAMWRILALVIAAIGAAAVLSPPGARAAAPGTWRTALTVPSGDIFDATFASPDVAWAAGWGGIFRSNDGGRSWATVYDIDRFGGFNSIAAAPDGQHGWAVGGLGLVAY